MNIESKTCPHCEKIIPSACKKCPVCRHDDHPRLTLAIAIAQIVSILGGGILGVWSLIHWANTNSQAFDAREAASANALKQQTERRIQAVREEKRQQRIKNLSEALEPFNR